MAGDALAVPRLEGVVVRVTSRDVGRDVERWNLTRVPEPLSGTEGEELGDVRRGDRRDRTRGQSVADLDRGVAVRRPVVDHDVGDLRESLAAAVLGGDGVGVLPARH